MSSLRSSDVIVYIYLLRCFQDPTMSVNINTIAKALNETVKEINVALNNLSEEQVISLTKDSKGRISNITLHIDDDSDEASDSAEAEACTITISTAGKTAAARRADSTSADASEKAAVAQSHTGKEAVKKDEPIVKPNYSALTISSYREEYPDFDRLIDYIEEKLGKTLRLRDLQTPAFLFDDLSFSVELIEYLYEYCVDVQKKTDSHYIEKVAINWHRDGVKTVSDAKLHSDAFTNRFGAVKKTFGLRRDFGEPELVYLRRWYDEYGFSEDIIKEACGKTLLKAGKPSFEYAETILAKWKSLGIKNTDDIEKLDIHEKAPAATAKKSTAKSGNMMYQFSQRSYSQDDFDELERQKLSAHAN